MNERENLMALLKRQPYEKVPVEFMLCPALEQTFHQETGSGQDYRDYFQMPWRRVSEILPLNQETQQFLPYYQEGLKAGTEIDIFGVAHEPGSEAAQHMTRMRHPLKDIDSVEQLQAYPFPTFDGVSIDAQRADVKRLREKGLVSIGNMQMTIWETAWTIRSMEELMVDMMSGEETAEYLLDKITEISTQRAKLYVEAGVEVLFIGDDIGMQHSTMMSEALYTEWLKPRQKRLIDEVRKVNPDVVVFYHSCGLIMPFIPHLIEVGIDVLNPIQTECMDFQTIYDMYADRLCFHGTIGTQKLMPFGTPQDVRDEVFRHLDIASKKGGLFVAPTHLLEPEVPWANILAYAEACRDYRK